MEYHVLMPRIDVFEHEAAKKARYDTSHGLQRRIEPGEVAFGREQCRRGLGTPESPGMSEHGRKIPNPWHLEQISGWLAASIPHHQFFLLLKILAGYT